MPHEKRPIDRCGATRLASRLASRPPIGLTDPVIIKKTIGRFCVRPVLADHGIDAHHDPRLSDTKDADLPDREHPGNTVTGTLHQPLEQGPKSLVRPFIGKHRARELLIPPTALCVSFDGDRRTAENRFLPPTDPPEGRTRTIPVSHHRMTRKRVCELYNHANTVVGH